MKGKTSMKIRLIIIVCLLSMIFVSNLFSQNSVTKADYLRIIKDTEEKIWNGYEAELDAWQNTDPTKRSKEPPKPNFFNGAKCEAFLYSVTGDKKYADRARILLLEEGGADYTVQAIRWIEQSGVLSQSDLKVIDDKIIKAADWAVDYWTEWGAMNHSTNHVVNLLTAVMDYLPNHPNYNRWKQKRDINLSSSWGLWSI